MNKEPIPATVHVDTSASRKVLVIPSLIHLAKGDHDIRWTSADPKHVTLVSIKIAGDKDLHEPDEAGGGITVTLSNKSKYDDIDLSYVVTVNYDGEELTSEPFGADSYDDGPGVEPQPSTFRAMMISGPIIRNHPT